MRRFILKAKRNLINNSQKKIARGKLLRTLQPPEVHKKGDLKKQTKLMKKLKKKLSKKKLEKINK